MKQKKTISTLIIAIILLSGIAAAVGIFSSGGPGNFNYETIRGETVTIYGIWLPFYVQFSW